MKKKLDIKNIDWNLWDKIIEIESNNNVLININNKEVLFEPFHYKGFFKDKSDEEIKIIMKFDKLLFVKIPFTQKFYNFLIENIY